MAGQLSMLFCLIMVMAASTTDYVNNWGQKFDFSCPKGQAISSISNIYNKDYEDRRWQFGCKEAGATKNCNESAWINNLKMDGIYNCPQDQVMTGMMAEKHNNTYKDRLFRLRCCNFNGRYRTDCYYPEMINNFGNEMIYQVPEHRFISGVVSTYEIKSNYYDRTWVVLTCDLKA